MGLRGTKSASREIKILKHVKPGRIPDEPAKVVPLYEIPAPPMHLTTRAKELWDKTAELLRQIEMLKEVDLGTLASYCSWTAVIEECSETLKEKPLDFKTIQAMSIATGHQTRIGQLFGFSPSARSSLGMQTKKKQQEESPLSKASSL